MKAAGLIVLAALGLGACGPTGPPPANPACSVDVRFDNADVAHIHGDTNLPGGSVLHVILDGNGARIAEQDVTIDGAGDASGTQQLPNYGYPVAWDVNAYYQGNLLCSDPWTTQGARYVTDPEWWQICAADAACAWDTALQR